MPLDVQSLQSFYSSPLGEVARRLVGRVVRARWDNVVGLSVAGLGYGTPYLERFRDGARRCLALMPAEQGVVVWPGEGRCSAALVDVQMLPLPDGAIDRLLVAHALEAVDRPDALLEELWRITAPEGRIIVIVPSRRGVWTRADSTPYGQGLPYSKSQLRDLLHRADFSPVFWGEALYAPPVGRPFMIRAGPAIERVGAALGLPFAGVHIVEAIKQVHRPVGVRAVARARLAPLKPVLAPSAHRLFHSKWRAIFRLAPPIAHACTVARGPLQQGETPCLPSIASWSCCAMVRANGT
jgi:SAM-dependent methyltransferase